MGHCLPEQAKNVQQYQLIDNTTSGSSCVIQ